MSDLAVFKALAAVVAACMVGVVFTLGAMWGARRAERRFRTPRIPVRRLGLSDTIHRSDWLRLSSSDMRRYSPSQIVD